LLFLLAMVRLIALAGRCIEGSKGRCSGNGDGDGKVIEEKVGVEVKLVKLGDGVGMGRGEGGFEDAVDVVSEKGGRVWLEQFSFE
jgi:hypothetical protein